MNADDERVVFVGASTRALAWSAKRAGFNPIAIDLFGDRDLRVIAPTYTIGFSDYPQGFAAAARRFRGLPLVYTGGLENYPDLLEWLERDHPLWGNHSSHVRLARDPARLAQVVLSLGARTGSPTSTTPRWTTRQGDVPPDGSWLWKPFNGSGGTKVKEWRGGISAESGYWQEKRSGDSHSFIALGRGDAADLLGVTRQWVGRASCHALPFQYCGSIGPVEDPALSALAGELAAALTSAFSLRGIFGVDFLWNGADFVLLEINPRWTASVEVLEEAFGTSFFSRHASVFDPSRSPRDRSPGPAQMGDIVGKAILYAPHRCRLGERGAERIEAAVPVEESTHGPFSVASETWLADLPRAGLVFEKGEPIVSILNRGKSIEAVSQSLDAALLEMTQALESA